MVAGSGFPDPAPGFTVVHRGESGDPIHTPIPADAKITTDEGFLVITVEQTGRDTPLLVVPRDQLIYMIQGAL